MRPLLLLATATIFAACGATNVNQDNYDKIKDAYKAEHGDAHGEDDKHEGEKKKSDDHGEKH